MNIEILFFIVFCMLIGYAIWKPLEVKNKKNAQKRLLETLEQANEYSNCQMMRVSPASSSGHSSTNHEELQHDT